MAKFMGIILAAGKGSRMKSDLPKVMHTVNGVPMVRRCHTALQQAGAEKIVTVVGYKKEAIEEELKEESLYAVQSEQKGTGHAVMSASDYLKGYDGNVVIVYGDNPLLNYKTLQKMLEVVEKENYTGSLLTIKLEQPPMAGRIIRDNVGEFIKIIEDQDCTPEQRKIQEINCGTYCFNSKALLKALQQLSPENNQNEYYLTDVPEIIVKDSGSIKTVEAEDIFEILGVNNQEHRSFAETAEKIKYAESLYDLIDASIEVAKNAK